MVGEDGLGLAGSQVPQPDSGVVASGDDLGIGSLRDHFSHGVGMARQGVYTGLGTHVPHLQHTHTCKLLAHGKASGRIHYYTS